MQSEMTGELVNRAKALLADKTVQLVLGWRRGLFDYDVTPSLFTSADDIEKNFVYNEYSAANLSKYLVKETRKIETAKNTVRANNAIAKQKDANAETQTEPEAKILVFLKPCDTYSFTELLKEHRIFRSDVYAIINELKKTGIAILLISSDMEEIIAMSDRVVTMYRGRINHEFAKNEINEDALMAASFGVETEKVG